VPGVLDGALRRDAAKIGWMDRQTVRDWVIRFNERGPEGLVNKSSPGAPGKLTDAHKAFSPASWRKARSRRSMVSCAGGPATLRLYQEFGLSVSDDTVCHALKDLGFSHMSARPSAYKQDAGAREAFKKSSRPRGREACALLYTDRGLVHSKPRVA
jgi:transposase